MINWLADIIAKRFLAIVQEEQLDISRDRYKIKETLKDIENHLKHLESQGDLTSFACVRIEHAIEDLKKNMQPKPRKRTAEKK